MRLDVFVILKNPPLHLITSKVMMIVWRLRGNIILFYIGNVLPHQSAQLTKNSSHSPVWP